MGILLGEGGLTFKLHKRCRGIGVSKVDRRAPNALATRRAARYMNVVQQCTCLAKTADPRNESSPRFFDGKIDQGREGIAICLILA